MNKLLKWWRELGNPWHYFGHCILCFIIALFRWDYAVVVAVTIELTQIESGVWNLEDTIHDLLFDGVGILVAVAVT